MLISNTLPLPPQHASLCLQDKARELTKEEVDVALPNGNGDPQVRIGIANAEVQNVHFAQIETCVCVCLHLGFCFGRLRSVLL